MKELKFCKNCHILLSEGFLGFKPQYYTFEDGFYCIKCARTKVDKSRREV